MLLKRATVEKCSFNFESIFLVTGSLRNIGNIGLFVPTRDLFKESSNWGIYKKVVANILCVSRFLKLC